MEFLSVDKNGYKVVFEEPTMYVDNEARGRSGHMTHAMAEFAPNCFIDFNSNCSAKRWGGHMPYGWVEYRTSYDGGETYSDVIELEYSKEAFLDGVHTISIEKAVGCDDGSIVALCLRNGAEYASFCEPWDTPTVIRSLDEGKSWTEPIECIPYKGRIYDAFYKDGVIYVLIFCNEHFLGSTDEHKYRLYKSFDNGLTFTEASVIPFNTLKRGYGSIVYDTKDVLHAYAYIQSDESIIDHAVSYDKGENWTVLEPCKVDRGARNPQTALIDGVLVLHGRSATVDSFVFYTSLDGSDWGEATVVAKTIPTGQYYSNNINLSDKDGNFLLVQYSESYNDARVNVKHLKLRIKKD